MDVSLQTIPKKAQFTGILELVCQALELTQTQFETARSRYEVIGKYLTEADSPLLTTSGIYPQGSVSLGTSVRPLGREEYDIDLVCLVPSLSPMASPEFLKKLIGDRLRSNGRYKDILEEKPRCWRINYANEFHLDITPSIPNPTCGNGGELVPDKKMMEWKPSNPKGYRQQFEEKAKLQPQLLLLKAAFAEARARVEDLPEPTKFKGLLKRCVQLCKRHRDLWFEGSELAPISIIITTLAAKSYQYCVTNHVYETELDALVDVIRRMDQFIETETVNGQTVYFVLNESTVGENFAEKWNQDPRRAGAFFRWQKQILDDIEGFLNVPGLDALQKSMAVSFGEVVVERAFASMTQTVSSLRNSRLLGVAPGIGLSQISPRGTPVRPNTFFGAC